MHSAPKMNSRFAKGTLLRTDRLLLGWEKRSYCGSFPRQQWPPLLPVSLPETQESPGESPERPAPGEPIPQPTQPGLPWEAAWAGREHRWRPLCPSEAVPGAAGYRPPSQQWPWAL